MTDNRVTYTASEIREMNCTPLWNRSIKVEKGVETKYSLYPTGDADLNGRKYIALPANIDPTNLEIRRKYNLI